MSRFLIAMLNVIIVSVIILSVIMLSFIMLSVVANLHPCLIFGAFAMCLTLVLWNSKVLHSGRLQDFLQ